MEDTAVREWKVRYPVSSRVARGVVEAIEKSTRRKARGVSMILYGALKQSISEDIAFSLTNLLSRISSSVGGLNSFFFKTSTRYLRHWLSRRFKEKSARKWKPLKFETIEKRLSKVGKVRDVPQRYVSAKGEIQLRPRYPKGASRERKSELWDRWRTRRMRIIRQLWLRDRDYPLDFTGQFRRWVMGVKVEGKLMEREAKLNVARSGDKVSFITVFSRPTIRITLPESADPPYQTESLRNLNELLAVHHLGSAVRGIPSRPVFPMPIAPGKSETILRQKGWRLWQEIFSPAVQAFQGKLRATRESIKTTVDKSTDIQSYMRTIQRTGGAILESIQTGDFREEMEIRREARSFIEELIRWAPQLKKLRKEGLDRVFEQLYQRFVRLLGDLGYYMDREEAELFQTRFELLFQMILKL